MGNMPSPTMGSAHDTNHTPILCVVLFPRVVFPFPRCRARAFANFQARPCVSHASLWHMLYLFVFLSHSCYMQVNAGFALLCSYLSRKFSIYLLCLTGSTSANANPLSFKCAYCVDHPTNYFSYSSSYSQAFAAKYFCSQVKPKATSFLFKPVFLSIISVYSSFPYSPRLF